MAGGRGAPGRGRDEPPESYPQRQDHELQALEAIYGADFQDLRPDARGRVGTWHVWSGLACCGPASLGAALPEANTRPQLRVLESFHPSQSTSAHFLSLHPQPQGGSSEPLPGTLTAFPLNRLPSYLALLLIPPDVP